MTTRHEDRWIYTACEMCNGNCGIRAHRVDGVVVKLEGDPNCPQDWGRMCAKGNAGIMQLYDPYRVVTPLKRTNPQKGIGVDPRWQQITWDEALDTVAGRLRKVRQDDPRKLVWSSWVKSLAMQFLNMVVGAVYVPGGFRGTNPVGPGRTWAPRAGPDGLLVQDPSPVAQHGGNIYEHLVKAPESLGFKELFPISSGAHATMQWNLLDPERRSRLPYTPEVLVHARNNVLMDASNPQQLAEFLKTIPFIVSLTPEIDEVAEFADIVLPDTQSLERLNLFPNRMHINNSPADGYFTWCIQQPVSTPPPDVRNWRDVLLELASRVGFTRELNQALNRRLRLRDDYRLEADRAYTYEEIADRWSKSQHGPERGLAWFQEHGSYAARRSVEERYPLPYLEPRLPVYLEIALRLGDQVKAVAEELGSWAQGKPLARGKGLHFGTLLPLHPDRIDSVTSALDGCVRVRVYRA